MCHCSLNSTLNLVTVCQCFLIEDESSDLSECTNPSINTTSDCATDDSDSITSNCSLSDDGNISACSNVDSDISHYCELDSTTLNYDTSSIYNSSSSFDEISSGCNDDESSKFNHDVNSGDAENSCDAKMVVIIMLLCLLITNFMLLCYQSWISMTYHILVLKIY